MASSVRVKCEISCTHENRAERQYYTLQMQTIMDSVRVRTGATYVSVIERPVTTLPYADALQRVEYQLRIYRTNRQNSHVRNLYEAFQAALTKADTFNCTYYLRIISDTAWENCEQLFTERIETFSLGFMSKADVFHSQFDYAQSLGSYNKKPRLTVEMDGQINIQFAVSSGLSFHKVGYGKLSPTTEVYSVSIGFKDLSPMVLFDSTHGHHELCFLTRAPVQLWRTQYDVTDADKINQDRTNWMRTSRIKSALDASNQISVNRDTLGGCHCLKIRFQKGLNSPLGDFATDFYSLLQSLESMGGLCVYNTTIKNGQSVWRPNEEAPFLEGKDEINWMLAAIYSINYRVKHQLTETSTFMSKVRSEAGQDDTFRQRHLVNALNQTYDVMCQDTDGFLKLDKVLDHFLMERMETSELAPLGRMVKKLIITPSRILFLAPSLQHDNRVLREFDPDFAVCCSFQNDDISEFMGSDINICFVRETIGEVLEQGIRVARRHYQFLGCSGSQLRSHGCWLYAKDSRGKTANDIREWMGDLDKIRNAGTYLARMGQCFSDTSRSLFESDIDIDWHDEDVKGGQDPQGNEYCFSDGVGRISLECLKEVFQGLPGGVVPSAFQVRLGGAKGMLTLDKRLTGKQIKVRKSMLKFESEHKAVEVMRRSQPTALFLNRQVITILSGRKEAIPDDVFIRLLYTMLHRLADTLLDQQRALVSLSQSSFQCSYAKLVRAGFDLTSDSFFKGLLKTVICSRLAQLKDKNRIEIPPEYGRSLLGVMDEEGVLEYGQIYVQYSADLRYPNQNTIVLTGDVVVSKMPALHPGDVRKLTAVDRPELRHLVDCVVFPQKGPRPHPNEMAGSDLDGDEYFVTWHPDLIFPGENELPMDFPSSSKRFQDNPITVSDMIDFIVNFIANNKVGPISNAHLAWADRAGIYSTNCLDLARIFSQVIDFNKSGVLPEEVKGRNMASLKPPAYPDFMGKQDHMETYTSTKVLGKLYRICHRIEQNIRTIDEADSKRVREGENLDERLNVPGHEVYLDRAKRLYNIYASQIDSLQRRYCIESEEEVVSACLNTVKGLYGRTDEKQKIEKRLKERMHYVTKFVQEKFEKILTDDPNIGEENIDKNRRMLASACYIVAYKDKKHRSFPWIFSEQMLAILMRQVGKPAPERPISQLTKSIDDIDMKDAERMFLRYTLTRPGDDTICRLYYVLVNWGQKSKYLPRDQARPSNNQLAVADFVSILDKVVEDMAPNDSDSSGELLCQVLKSITALKEEGLKINDQSVERQKLINLKRQILICHHQLARDANVKDLFLQQKMVKKRLHIPPSIWVDMNPRLDKIKQAFSAGHDVKVQFVKKRHGGQMTVRGLDNSVFDFMEFWHDTFDIRNYISDEEEESDSDIYYHNSDDDDDYMY